MDNKIKLLKGLLNPSCTIADMYYETLDNIKALKRNYWEYLITDPINIEKELERLPAADYDLCAALLTMLLREDHFSNGSFGERFKNGDVQPIVQRMIYLLMQSKSEE